MHPKYHDVLDPAYLAYALDVERNSAGPTGDLALLRQQYQETSHRHRPGDYADLQIDDSTVTSRDGQPIAVRVYGAPEKPSQSLTMYVHGGGWVLGNLDSHDDICADICRQTETTVLAIDYRLAPEHPFPAALHDCIDVLNALAASTSDGLATLQPDSLVLAGDSAGANLVTAACLSGAWPASDVFKGLVLFYPGLSDTDALPAFQEHREAPLLPQPFLDFFVHAYLDGGTIEPTELTSPLLATDLSAIPACHIAAAEHDPLRDDAIVFAEKLQAQGIACSLEVLASLGHGFLRVRRSSEPAGTAFARACKAMVALHTGQF